MRAATAAAAIVSNHGSANNNNGNNVAFDLVSPSSQAKSPPLSIFAEQQFVLEAKEVGGGAHGSGSYNSYLSSVDKTSSNASLTPFASYNHALHAHVPHRHRKQSSHSLGGERGPGGSTRLGTGGVGGGGGGGGGVSSPLGAMSIPNRLVV